MMTRKCPDCAVEVGQQHEDGCDVERCPDCGYQAISCGCENVQRPRIPWAGEWPGNAECREFGMFAKFKPGQGWVKCDENDHDACPDLNSLYQKAVWDANSQRFRLRPATTEEEKLEALRKDAFAKLREAEKAWYAYFCELPVGDARIEAHEVYTNVLYATRIR